MRILALLLISLIACSKPEKSFNILLISADDMGFSDVGCYGGEINTPNLDRLGREGIRFSQFYTAPTCSPTRAMLYSGADYHLAGLGTMNGMETDNQKGLPGYETYLNQRVTTIAEILSANDYHTYLSGKWHMGNKEGYTPHERGFEESFALMPGGANHFIMQAIVPNRTPDYRRNSQKVEKLPANFYSSTAYTDSMISFIDHHKDDGKAFFGYLSFTAPHWPLQAPDSLIQKYIPVYEKGWNKLMNIRLKKQQKMELFSDSIKVSHSQNWDSLKQEQQRYYAKEMAIYAAMVEKMDQEIGRLINYLDQKGLRENTIIIFFSDNGAAKDDLAKEPTYDLDIRNWIAKDMDNSYEHMGGSNSYICYGKKWAQLSNTPFRGYKGYPYEGGIRTPCIVSIPSLESAAWNHHVFAIQDLFPTILDIVHVEPGDTYHGKKLLPRNGHSWWPHLSQQHSLPKERSIGWELFNRKTFRKGKWKAVHIPPARNWELYDLEQDPIEQHNLANVHKDTLRVLQEKWKIYEREQGVILGVGSPYYPD